MVREPIDSCEFTASGFRKAELEHFVEVASELGIKIECELSSTDRTARIKVSELPDVYDARTQRTRNAGRRRYPIVPPADSIFTVETTCEEFLKWQNGHSAIDGMRQLGLKRSTYYRRLKIMKDAVRWEQEHNPARVKEGMREIHHTIGWLPASIP